MYRNSACPWSVLLCFLVGGGPGAPGVAALPDGASPPACAPEAGREVPAGRGGRARASPGGGMAAPGRGGAGGRVQREDPAAGARCRRGRCPWVWGPGRRASPRRPPSWWTARLRPHRPRRRLRPRRRAPRDCSSTRSWRTAAPRAAWRASAAPASCTLRSLRCSASPLLR